MTKIKILDCTLRDGGYVNDWEFGKNNILTIIDNLSKAKIEYIECGFLKTCHYNENKTLFDSIEILNKHFLKNDTKTKYALMINYGEVDIDLIPENFDENLILRIAFKKNQATECLEYCEKLIQKGYDIFINPMHTSSYSSIELIDIIKKVNAIKPLAFTIVDTTGSMKEQDLLSIYYLIDSNLAKDIALCLHSHNNLQLSFSNAKSLMNACKNRELIIDATAFGIGRGAGNLQIELLVQYLNDNYNREYDIIPILKTINEQINPIFAQTPWGYSVPYYLAAVNHCHPNYAKYLVDKQTIPVDMINELLMTIPNDKKTEYDVNLIKQIYLDKFSK